MSVLDQIVKAYDIRGTVPDQLDAEVAYALGVGFATFVSADEVVLARDMRPSGPELVDAFARGVMEQGVDVIDIGLASTDLMYYASGVLDRPGAMFTASHNPAWLQRGEVVPGRCPPDRGRHRSGRCAGRCGTGAQR